MKQSSKWVIHNLQLISLQHISDFRLFWILRVKPLNSGLVTGIPSAASAIRELRGSSWMIIVRACLQSKEASDSSSIIIWVSVTARKIKV